MRFIADGIWSLFASDHAGRRQWRRVFPTIGCCKLSVNRAVIGSISPTPLRSCWFCSCRRVRKQTRWKFVTSGVSYVSPNLYSPFGFLSLWLSYPSYAVLQCHNDVLIIFSKLPTLAERQITIWLRNSSIHGGSDEVSTTSLLKGILKASGHRVQCQLADFLWATVTVLNLFPESKSSSLPSVITSFRQKTFHNRTNVSLAGWEKSSGCGSGFHLLDSEKGAFWGTLVIRSVDPGNGPSNCVCEYVSVCIYASACGQSKRAHLPQEVLHWAVFSWCCWHEEVQNSG